MIFPTPENIQHFERYPLTWTLLAVNVFIFFVFFIGQPKDLGYSKVLSGEGIEVTGRAFMQYYDALPEKEKKSLPKWIEVLDINNSEQMTLAGAFALRNGKFLNFVPKAQFSGNAVELENWQKNLQEFNKESEKSPLFQFGLTSISDKPLAWLTYQFSHSGFLHLLSNIVFLVFIGAAVEAWIGSFGLILVYLFGGFFGGWLFLTLNSHGVVPMVGASAAVSALLAVYFVIEKRQRIRYFFFVSPMPGHNGFIYLPVWILLPMFLLSDFSSYLSNPEGLASGIAYSAHIGGTLFGLVCGLFIRFGLKLKRDWREFDLPPIKKISEPDDEF